MNLFLKDATGHKKSVRLPRIIRPEAFPNALPIDNKQQPTPLYAIHFCIYTTDVSILLLLSR